MCGLVGQLAFGKLDKKKETLRQDTMIFFGSELLQMTQERGKDATGVTTLFEDGNYIGLKMGIPSVAFVSRFGKNDKEYGGFVKIWRESHVSAKIFLGHCRNITKGTSLDNVNNHPIKTGEIIGVHNGTIRNDEVVFDRLGCKRNGKVDSEAIFRLLQHYTENGQKPFTTDMLKETMDRLMGSFAVMAFSGNNPYQICMFRDSRPIEMALIKPLKILVIASEKKFIDTAMFRYNKHINLYETDREFPTLKKSDIEHKALPDDSAAVFDLRSEIKEDTKIIDLYEWTKVHRNKIWKVNHATQTWDKDYGWTPKNNRKFETGYPIAKGSKKSSDGRILLPHDKENKQAVGRVWNKMMEAYTELDPKAVKEMKKIRSVELDVSTGTAKEVGASCNEDNNIPFENRLKKITKKQTKEEDGKFTLRMMDKKTENRQEIPATIVEIRTERHINADSENATQPFKTVEVGTSICAEAVEKAEEEVKKLRTYESMEEILGDLEIQEDIRMLRRLPTVSLVNKIQKFIFKKGVYVGYSNRKSKKGWGTKKKTAAEETIIGLKNLVKMLLKIVSFSGYVNNGTLDKVVTEAFNEKEGTTKEILDKVFRPGDERNSHLIARIKQVVTEKEER